MCILTSVLTNTSQLTQRTPGQPGRHSTGCVHRLAGRERTCQSGDVASGRLVGQGGLSKKAQKVKEDSRCKWIQGNISKGEIKGVCLNSRS